MKIITAQPDQNYLLWQLEIQAYNQFKLNNLHNFLPIVGIRNKQSDYLKYLIDKGINIQVYEDSRETVPYIPSIKPHLLKKYITENHESFMLCDGDLIFREKIDSSLFKGDTWYVSDTISYIGYEYIVSKGEDIFLEMCNIVGIDPEIIKKNQLNSGGAQYIVKNTNQKFWQKVEDDCLKLYEFMDNYEKTKYVYKENDYPIQKWTAEMWATLWNAFLISEVRVVSELDFCWASCEQSNYNKSKMLHLAGLTALDDKNKTVFFKGNFIDKLPFDENMNKYIINNNTCSKYYAELILQYSRLRNKIKYN